MKNVFITSDIHLSHSNIVLHCKRFPWILPNPNFDPSKPKHIKNNYPQLVDIESHDNDMIQNWNSIVGKNDEVWILGDFAWKRHSHFIMKLNGTKYLIRGNHDKMDLTSYQLFAKKGDAHYQYSYYTEIYGKRVMLSHCPYETWFSSCHGSWNLHGHCHGRLPEKPEYLRFDVGVDVWGYYPIPWDVIEQKMAEKEKIKKEFSNSKDHDKDDSNNRIEVEAGESFIHFNETRIKNIELMKNFGVINEKK